MSLEQELRLVLADDRYALPGWPDAPHRVATGVRWRRRRRYAMLSGAAAAIVILATVSGALNLRGMPERAQPAAPGAEPVPWVDTTATMPAHLARRDPRPSARSCGSADLGPRAWTEDGGNVGSRHVVTVLLANASDTVCTLDGSAQLSGSAGASTAGVIPTVVGAPVDDGVNQYPATVEPGEPVRIDLVVATSCAEPAPAKRYHDLVLTVRGRALPLAGVELESTCPIIVGSWYAERSLLNAPLTVSIDGPAQAQRGTVYQYVVTVTNTSGGSFALDPCPVYQQTLAGGKDTRLTRRLNCVQKTIAPRHHLRFAMRLPVPANTPLGAAKLTWMAVMGDGMVAIANLGIGGTRVEVVD